MTEHVLAIGSAGQLATQRRVDRFEDTGVEQELLDVGLDRVEHLIADDLVEVAVAVVRHVGRRHRDAAVPEQETTHCSAECPAVGLLVDDVDIRVADLASGGRAHDRRGLLLVEAEVGGGTRRKEAPTALFVESCCRNPPADEHDSKRLATGGSQAANDFERRCVVELVDVVDHQDHSAADVFDGTRQDRHRARDVSAVELLPVGREQGAEQIGGQDLGIAVPPLDRQPGHVGEPGRRCPCPHRRGLAASRRSGDFPARQLEQPLELRIDAFAMQQQEVLADRHERRISKLGESSVREPLVVSPGSRVSAKS